MDLFFVFFFPLVLSCLALVFIGTERYWQILCSFIQHKLSGICKNASFGPRYCALGTRDTERRNIPFLSSVYLQSVESRCKTVGWAKMDQKNQLLSFNLIFLSIIDFFYPS